MPEEGYKCKLNLKVYQKLNLFVVLLNLHFLVVYDNSLLRYFFLLCVHLHVRWI
jgi:hypothetical protein